MYFMSSKHMHYAHYRKGKPVCVQTCLVQDTENACAELNRANQNHITTTRETEESNKKWYGVLTLIRRLQETKT